MTQPTYYTPAGIPVFVDPPQHSGETMPDRRIEVYVDRRTKQSTARSFTGKVSVPCAVPERLILDGVFDHKPGCRAPDYGPCTCAVPEPGGTER